MFKLNFFVQICISLTVFVHISNYFYKEKLFDKSVLTKIGTFLLIWCIFIVKIPTDSSLLVFFWLQLPNFILFSMRKPIILYREYKFRQNFILFLSQLVLELQTGSSFRASIFKMSPRFPKVFRQKIDEIMNIVAFSQHTPSNLQNTFVLDVIHNLKVIDSSSHQAKNRARSYLEQLKINHYFRQKSGQIMNQIYIQALVMSLLFFSVLTFVVQKYGFFSHRNTISISTLVFVMGILWLIQIGKSFKWKI